MAAPTISSLRPKLYPGAVSIRLTPSPGAARMVAAPRRSPSAPPNAGPPPMAHVPSPIRETSGPAPPILI